MREIPWFGRHGARRPSQPAKRLRRFLEADSDAVSDAIGCHMFGRFYVDLTGDLLWADDPDMPAPYRVVRGWDRLA